MNECRCGNEAGAAVLAKALRRRMDLGTSGRWIAQYGESPETLADDLAPLIAAARAEAWAEGRDADFYDVNPYQVGGGQ